jgi:hypothetical protein
MYREIKVNECVWRNYGRRRRNEVLAAVQAENPEAAFEFDRPDANNQ